jgi:hypothetical protein
MDTEQSEQAVENNAPDEEKVNKEEGSGEHSGSSADPRTDPLFLKVADYFGVNEKTYRIAVNKVCEIIDWAINETGTKNPSDIILKIAETSRSLQSPGYGEHRWAILHRYVRLSNEAKPIKESIGSLEKKKADIEKEMRAYQHGIT